jgi:hypothetical protein
MATRKSAAHYADTCTYYRLENWGFDVQLKA